MFLGPLLSDFEMPVFKNLPELPTTGMQTDIDQTILWSICVLGTVGNGSCWGDNQSWRS